MRTFYQLINYIYYQSGDYFESDLQIFTESDDFLLPPAPMDN